MNSAGDNDDQEDDDVVVAEGEAPVDPPLEDVAHVRSLIDDHRVVSAVGVTLCFAAMALPSAPRFPWISPTLALLGITVGIAGALRWKETMVDAPQLLEELTSKSDLRFWLVRICWGLAVAAAWAWYLCSLPFTPRP
jgi:hypothetical protein